MYFIEDCSGYKWYRVSGLHFLTNRRAAAEPGLVMGGGIKAAIVFYD